ncbi:hypothetical protein C0J00_07635 [Streptococcus pluranimalium]|uniref:Transposase n=1 Tax=Streptococcus pluranimalium TaxID=82348 RepID=A0A2L0D5A9_9STRE|nr:hypothetical protein C0J00_07635 [Streptococcus pluranimalium]
MKSSKLETGVFCYGQKAYSVETKLACIEMKEAGKSNKVTLGIKNDSQIYTWLKWSIPRPFRSDPRIAQKIWKIF